MRRGHTTRPVPDQFLGVFYLTTFILYPQIFQLLDLLVKTLFFFFKVCRKKRFSIKGRPGDARSQCQGLPSGRDAASQPMPSTQSHAHKWEPPPQAGVSWVPKS